MSFWIGYSLIIALFGVMVLVGVMQRLLPRELSIALMYGMIIVDGIVAYTYYYGGTEFVSDDKLFRLGIALSFMTMTVVKCTYFALRKLT